MKINLISEYLELQKQYIREYGNNTLVMMEVGSFYELYAVSEAELNALKEACVLMGIRITRKNNKTPKDNVDVSNPYMAGITSIAFNKYMKILLNNNFTVVKIDQVTPPPNPKREVTRIYSPGTYWEENNNKDTCNIVSIYIEGFDDERKRQKLYSIGIYILDLSTGESYITEYHDARDGNNKLGALTDTYKLLYNYDPNEIIFAHHNAPELEEIISEKLNIQINHFHNKGCIDSKYLDISFQDKLLSKYYSCSSNLDSVDYLGLSSNPHSLVSLILGLDFAYEHSKSLTISLPKPKIIHDNDILYLSYQTIEKLDIIGYKNNKSLYNLINLCTSSPGKRLLKKQLLNPIYDKEKLEKIYNEIETIQPIYSQLENNIKYAYDIERLHRKILTKSIKPYEFFILHGTYNIINSILDILKDNKMNDTLLTEGDKKEINSFQQICTSYLGSLNIDLLNKFSQFSEIDENIFKEGECQELDNLISNKKKYWSYIENFRIIIGKLSQNKKEPLGEFFKDKGYEVYKENKKEEFNKKYKLENDSYDYIKIDSNEKDGHYFKMTKTRYKDLKKNIENRERLRYFISEEYLVELDRLTFKEKTSEVIMISPIIKKNSEEVNNIDLLISDITKIKFYQKIEELFSNKLDCIDWLNRFLAEMDTLTARAKMAKLYHYCRPKILDGNKSGIIGKNIRHAIIERLNKKNIFTPNDIGIGDLSNKNSMLITGLNGVGKSVYIKSIAMCVIMAQAGFYVPAESFEYVPYKKLYTRIGNNDNIFKGQSTFYCEMLELEDIIRNSDNQSLVIADELCSGSEHYSAQSILATTILELDKKEVNFLLTTHFHQALELPEINNLEKSVYYHFAVNYDKETGNIIYQRKLREGIGEKLYGVEVAENIIANSVFIKKCYELRERMLIKGKESNNREIKKSKYNSALIVEKCEVCGEKGEGLHTHHIKEQHTANKLGNIEHFHKNNLGNLVVLCEKHHDMVHHGNLEIRGWKETQNNGRLLDYSFIDEKKKVKHLKYSKEEAKLIKEVESKTSGKLKQAKIILETENGFHKISITTIKKIWEDKYFN